MSQSHRIPIAALALVLLVFLAAQLSSVPSARAAATGARATAPNKPARRPPAAERILVARLDDAITAGNFATVPALADSLARLREARGIAATAIAAGLDSVALRSFAGGSTDALRAARAVFGLSITRRERALGPDHPDVARTLYAAATVGEYLGDYEPARRDAARALAIREARLAPGDAAIAASLRQVGMLDFALGRYASADSLVARAAAIYAALPDAATSTADALNSLGEVQRVADRFDAAEASFRRGLELARTRLPEDAPLRVSLLNNLAGLYKDLARYDDAEPLLEQSLALRDRAGGDSAAIATACLNLAEVRRLQGRNDEAAPLYERALTIARRMLGPGHPDLAPFANQAAVSFAEAGRYDDAEPLFRAALADARAALGDDHPLVAQSLHDLGDLLERRGAHAAADSAYRAALAIRVARLGPDHPETAATRVRLARALAHADRAADAERELAPAIVVLDRTRTDPVSRLDAHVLRAELRAAEPREALPDLRLAVALVDTLRRTRGGGDAARARLIAGRLEIYDRAVAAELAAGNADAALELHERGRARVLRDQLERAGFDPRLGMDPVVLAPLARAEDEARVALARSQRALEAATYAQEGTEAERRIVRARLEAARDSAAWAVARAADALRERNPAWRALLGAAEQPLSRAALQRTLAKEEIALEYHVGARGSWLFVLGPRDRPQAYPLTVEPEDAAELGIAGGPLDATWLARAIEGDSAAARRRVAPGVADRLSGALGGAVAELGGEADAALVGKLRALANVLVPQAVRARIAKARVAVVAPDGALHRLPFDALVTTPEGAPVRYWLDDLPALRYESSLTSLARLAERTPPASATQTVLTVSDPTYSFGRWAPLPGTRRETEAVRAAFASAEALQGEAANEPAVRAALGTHRILHLATHGFVTERSSDVLGGIVLARGAGDGAESDGLLQLFEIYGLALDADLAVLSACETARGPQLGGEGVFALSRGFLAAGSRRVIATLWPVHDTSTAELIGALFQGAGSARGSDWALRLRDAKRTLRLRAEWERPFHWAPFVLTGVR